MTDVLVRLTAPSSGAVASGWVPADEVAAVGHLECRPYAPDADGARLHLEGPDRLLLPASFTVRLVGGEALLHLAPTGAGWCWQIIERTPRGKTRYVLVPDSVATLGYAPLVDVDPTTLDPAAEPEAAWWAAWDALASGLMVKSANLSDLADKAAARANLGHGNAATKNVGTGADDVKAGDYAPDLSGYVQTTDARLSTTDTKTVKILAAAASVTVSTAYAVNRLVMTMDTVITPSLVAGSDPITALHLSGAFVPTWAASIDWPDGTAPTYTSPALYVFLTVDAGTSWVAVQSAKAIA